MGQGPGQGDSHLQQPSGSVLEAVSRLLSVSEARVGSVDTSLTDEDDTEGYCWEPLLTAAPVLKTLAVPGSLHSSFSPPSPGPPCISNLSTPPLCVPSHPAACQ